MMGMFSGVRMGEFLPVDVRRGACSRRRRTFVNGCVRREARPRGPVVLKMRTSMLASIKGARRAGDAQAVWRPPCPFDGPRRAFGGASKRDLLGAPARLVFSTAGTRALPRCLLGRRPRRSHRARAQARPRMRSRPATRGLPRPHPLTGSTRATACVKSLRRRILGPRCYPAVYGAWTDWARDVACERRRNLGERDSAKRD